MTIREMIGQGFYYARTCRSLWLFGFFVGLAAGGSNGGRGGGAGRGPDLEASRAPAAGAARALWNAYATELLVLAAALILVVGAFIVLRFICEGALIEGVARARQGGALTMREAFRAGWAHWGVLVRIALLYVAATIGSVALFVLPCVIAARAFGPLGAVAVGLPTLVIAVPWLVTLYVVQAFAWRIAVLENRGALDAIAKARLFLHGRLLHGLKLIVATFIGTLGFALVSILVLTPVVLLLVALVPVLRILPVIVLGAVVLLPVVYVLVAMLGTFRSSVWTIGYMTQVES